VLCAEEGGKELMPPKGQHLSESAKQKIRESKLGKKQSIETIKKLSAIRKGKKRNPNRNKWPEELRHRWSLAHHNISEETRNKLRIANGKIKHERKLFYPERKCEVCGILIPERYKNNGLAKWLTRRFCSKPCKGKAMRGIKKPPMTDEQRIKMRNAKLGKFTGSSNPNWKGGVPASAYRSRKILRDRGNHSNQEWQWLKLLFNYTCPSCGKKEPTIRLNKDHIIPLIKQGSTDRIYNIQPLCQSCNSKKHTKIIAYPKWGERLYA
jgi:hypothetical protein